MPAVVRRLRGEIRDAAPRIRSADELEAFAGRFADRLIDERAREVNRLEARIREAVPRAQVIDVEGD